MKPQVFVYSAAVLYGISTLHYLLYLIFQKEKLAVVGLYSARFGFLTNLAALILLVLNGGGASLFTPKGAFLLLGISVVSVFLYYSTKHRLSLSGAFLMPWATVSLLVASFSSGTPKVELPVGTVGMVHIVSAFLGYSAFIFAGVLSVIYLIFERHLKKKKFSVFFHKLPSLSLLETVIYRAITVGFMFITVSMFAGAVWSERLFGTYWSWHPKQVATLISWFVYAGVIHLYLYGNWKGKRLCYLSLAGLSVIMLNFIGVNLLSSKDIHSFKG
jgi:ABC-type transport system involved in cytochrome c biogenesis permease subunit